MAVNDKHRKGKMVKDFLQIFLVVNVLSHLAPCRASLDVQRQAAAFIQTNNELRYMVDGELPLHTPDQGVHDLNSLVRLDPPVLDYGEQPVGMPIMEQVIVQNLDSQTSLHLLSISGSSSHFHCSFFQDKLVPPRGNTTFEVCFLARQVGNVETTLYIHSSKGSFRYQVLGVGIDNPYRIRPFLGAKVPVNSSFSPLIQLHNPHESILQVQEIYTSGGDLHLELPTGEVEASKELWEIPPFETKSIMKASFMGRVENNHTAFIRIKTNKENKQEMLIVPVEVEVTSAPGLFSLLEMLDFGMLRTQDEPFSLRLNLINSGAKPIQITNITVQPPNSAIHIEFWPVQIKPDVLHPTSVAVIFFTASKALSPKQWSGRIIVKSKNSQYRLTIPYQAQVLHGSLVYDKNSTMFFTGSKLGLNVTHQISITNSFSFTIVIYNISLPVNLLHLFSIHNFSKPILIHPHQTLAIFNLTFHPNSSMLHFVSDVYLHTNTSVFKIPLYIYNGRLKVVHHRPEIFKGQLDFGTLAIGEKRSMNFTLRNNNPIDMIISKFSSNMVRTVVRLLGMEKGNGTTLSQAYNVSKLEGHSLILKPYHIAVFSVELIAPDEEGTFSAEVIFETQFEYLYIPMTLRTAVGSLHVVPDYLLLNSCFPGRISLVDLRVHSTFQQTLKVREVLFSPNDTRFYYVPIMDKPISILQNQESLIGHIYFDPRRTCKEDCYATLPTHIPAGHTWLLSSSLDKEVTDTDQYLYSRFRQKWEHMGISQTSIANVTVQLDTNQVRGFLFPAQAHFQWPNLVKKSKYKFPLTQIGNVSFLEFHLENPSDVPIIVQIVPLPIYPNAQLLLDTIASSLLPDVGYADLDMEETEVFTLPDLLELTSPSTSASHGNDRPSMLSRRKAIENTLGVRPNKNTLAFMLQSRAKMAIQVGFQPKDDVSRTTLFFVRNNLTIMEVVVFQGQGGIGELRFSHRKPGSNKPLMFEMTDKHLKSCDKKQQSKNIQPNFTVKRTFTLRNTGQLPLYIHGFSIGNALCESYGFKVLDCSPIELQPNSSHKVDIVFTPDFTMSRIRQMLTLHTSLGEPVNYSLQATIPAHMLTQCAAALPRPHWEPMLYYSIVLAMGFLFCCVGVAAYFESDRIFTADLLRRRTENHMVYDKAKVFDLKAIAAEGMFSSTSHSSQVPFGQKRYCVGSDLANGYADGGKPNSNLHPHRKDSLSLSYMSRFFRKFMFWKKSLPVLTSSMDMRYTHSNLEQNQLSSTCSTVSPTGAPSVDGGETGKLRRFCRYLMDSFVVYYLARRWKSVTQRRATKTTKSTKPAADKSKDLISEPAACENSQPVSGTHLTQRKNIEQEHSLKRKDPDGKAGRKEKHRSISPLIKSLPSSPTIIQNSSMEDSSAKKEVTTKNSKARKPKASDNHRLREKLQESEKIDKEDSSSTTTETSSIEADDKQIATSSRSQCDHEAPKAKKAKGKGKQDLGKQTVVLEEDVIPDQFIVNSKSKSNKKKGEQTTPTAIRQSPSTNEVSSTDTSSNKRGSTSSSSTAGGNLGISVNKPKQVCLPLMTDLAQTRSSTTGSSMRKKKNRGMKGGRSRCFSDRNHCDRESPVPIWDMPPCDPQHDDLGDIVAQTNVFAKTWANVGSAVGMKIPNPEVSSANRFSGSYSSIVGSVNKIAEQQSQPDKLSIAKPASMSPISSSLSMSTISSSLSMSTISSSLLPNMDALDMGPLPITGATASRPGPSRPVAAVGATVRRPWSAYGQGNLVLEDAPMCHSSIPTPDMLPMAGLPTGAFPEIDPVLAGFSGMGLNPPHLAFPSEGSLESLPYSYPMIPEQRPQNTLMQKLTADRRKRVLEYQRNRYGCSPAEEWPGFGMTTYPSAPPDSLWEPSVALTPNPWSMSEMNQFQAQQQQQQQQMLNMPRLGSSGSSSSMWNEPGMPGAGEMLNWNTSASNIWGAPADLGIPQSPMEDDASQHTVFDPFNTLETGSGSIWNPTSMGSGWAPFSLPRSNTNN